MACDHVHSVELFTESINGKCPFMAITCDSFESFRKGRCSRCNRDGNHCFQFGFHAPQSYRSHFSQGHVLQTGPIATYFMTSPKEPFCKTHFKVTVKVAENDESRMHGGEVGFLYLKLKSSKVENAKFLVNQQSVHFGPGMNYTFLAIGDDIEDVRSALVDYRHKSTANPLTWRVFTPKIYLEYILIESMEHPSGGELKMCPNHGHAISSGDGLLFKEDSCDYRRDNRVK
jgi:pancreatic triacylglycerol lipase